MADGNAVVAARKTGTLALEISVVHHANSNICIGSVDIQLWRFEKLADGTRGLVLAASDSFLSSGPKHSFQQQLRQQVNQMVSALANEILKARGR